VAREAEPLPAGRCIPDLHERSVAGRSHPLAVGADRHAPDFAVLGEGQGFLALARPQGSRVPDANGPVVTDRREARAVRAERRAPTHFGVSRQAEHLPTGRRVPDMDRLVLPDRGEPPAVRAEGDAQDVSVVREGLAEFVGRRIPQTHAPTEAGRGQPSAVRAERQRGDGVARRRQAVEGSPRFRVPKIQTLLPGAGRRQVPTVAAERDRDRMVFGSGEPVLGSLRPVLLPVPDPHHLVASRRQVPAVGRTERHGVRHPERADCVTGTLELRLVVC
jgi:hypothetical protein